jgi:hypothetical protein
MPEQHRNGDNVDGCRIALMRQIRKRLEAASTLSEVLLLKYVSGQFALTNDGLERSDANLFRHTRPQSVSQTPHCEVGFQSLQDWRIQ